MDKDFEKYLKNARARFCLVFRDYNAKEVDDFLIAYDQAVQKAIDYSRCCESDSEQLFNVCNCDDECMNLDCSVIKCKKGNKR